MVKYFSLDPLAGFIGCEKLLDFNCVENSLLGLLLDHDEFLNVGLGYGLVTR